MFAASRSDAAPRRDPVAVLLLFAGIALVLAAFSPWSVRGAGYTGEDLRAIGDGLRALRGAVGLGPAFRPAQFPRHGAASLAGHLPFVLLARLLFGSDAAAQDRLVSLEPVLATALIGAVVFAWLRRAGAGVGRARIVTLLAVFGTLLWPYAYIGLETTQSAALIVAGFVAIGGASRTRGRTAIFAAAAALALCAKATSVFLLPAVAYLGFEYFREEGASRERRRRRLAGPFAVAIFVAAVFAVNAWTRTFWWAQLGGTRHVIGKWLVLDPFVFLAHLVSLFGSANKGLFFYAPVLAAAALAAPRAWRRDRRVVVFAFLTALGLAAGFSLIRNWWSDETWGPRYLHSAVAPLALLLGIAWPEDAVPRAWRAAVAGLGALGIMISFLGVFFYYGLVQRAATSAGQSTLETLQGDPVWNAVVFDGRLFRAWVRGSGRPGAPPAIWVPSHYWWYATPAGFRGWPEIDLGRLAHPQPLLFRRGDELGPGDRPFRALSFAALAAGILLLAAEAGRSRRSDGGETGRRIGSNALVVFFAAVLAASWARSWTNTLRGRFYLGAGTVRDSPGFRTVLAAAEHAVPAEGVLLGVGRLPDWNATHWSRWLYPRRVIWIGPGAPREPGIRGARGAHYALVLAGTAEGGVRLGRLLASGGGAELREIAP